jgi:two-component system sensor histidine kinase KdpD
VTRLVAHSNHASYVAGLSVVGTAALVAWFAFGRSELADVVLVLLLGVVVVSMRLGPGPSLFAAIVSALVFEFFFIPPYFSFAIAGLRHAVTFAVLFVVALVVTHIMTRAREEARAARTRERRTATLFAVSRDLGLAHSRDGVVSSAAHHARQAFGAKVAIFLPDGEGALEAVVHDAGALGDAERKAVEWVWPPASSRGVPCVPGPPLPHEGPAGLSSRPRKRGVRTMVLSRAQVALLEGAAGPVGVLGIVPAEPARLLDPDERQFFDAFADLLGTALERRALADEARPGLHRVS